MAPEIEWIEQNERRGVAVLKDAEFNVDLGGEIDKLPANAERSLRTGIDWWVAGQENKNRFHGWNQTEFGGRYTECFVFKCKGTGSKHLHFYGFLCHPDPGNPRFQACVLVLMIDKKQWQTRESDLAEVERFRQDPRIQSVLRSQFQRKGS